ncbi:unnamed protein product [Lepeophtheirus salmonis]|uniref:(salmon louse) hypothetical protein n=1 Tax=Lepeophtheirus salmonis TaxID=72036 RepID=A0A7R8H333_LEPSM|nr:unnamed protein product [Lepeophtheirus salmonis]CAF2839822.1 unnamed protein product [Lepeophtheirus salmonis]
MKSWYVLDKTASSSCHHNFDEADGTKDTCSRKRKKSLSSLDSSIINKNDAKKLKNTNVGGVCPSHKKAKKGVCQHCGVCRLCDPPSTCSSEGNHINWRKKLKKTSPQVSKEESTSFRIKNNSIFEDGDYQFNPSNCKNKMTRIASFTSSSIDKKGRSFGRAKLAYKRISNGIKNLICPTDPSLLEDMSSNKSDDCCKKSLRKITSNLVKLSFFGNKTSRVIAQCLMASSFTRNSCVKYLNEEFEYLDGEIKSKVQAKSRLMGTQKFTNLHKTFNCLINGADIPKQDYSSRIDSSRIANVISFIQEREPLKPGSGTRNIQVSGYIFKHIPQYGRSKKSIEMLQAQYCSLVTAENRIGRQTFRDTIMAMTKGNETKNEVSPYFLRFKHLGNIFCKMLRRIHELNPMIGVSEMETSWEKIRRFLMWEFGNRHVQHRDIDAIHCCQFALGESCGHIHADRSCSRCAECFTFFPFRVKEMLISVLEIVKEDCKFEISSMINEAIPKMNQILVEYMGYRLRIFHRFNAVDKIKNELAETDHGSKVLILIDHMEKVFPLKYSKPELLENPPDEYFSNKGICIVGTIEIQYGSSGFQCRHIDYVFKDYYTQDNVQVAAVIEMISRNILSRHPSVKEIIFQSDNSSCFSEPELIPFIFNLNDSRREDGEPLIKKWIFTDVRPGVSELSAHFYLLSSIFKAYWNQENSLNCEEDLLKAFSLCEALKGTTVLLLDASHLNGPIVNQKFKVRRINPREMREIYWSKDYVEIFGNLSLIITTVELQFATQDILVSYIQEEFEYSPSKEESLANPKKSKFQDDSSKAHHMSYPLAINTGWAKEKCEFTPYFSTECLSKLRELHVRNKDRGKKITSEEAHTIISETILQHCWGQLVDLTHEDVKSFLHLSASKMAEIIDGGHSLEPESSKDEKEELSSSDFDEFDVNDDEMDKDFESEKDDYF